MTEQDVRTATQIAWDEGYQQCVQNLRIIANGSGTESMQLALKVLAEYLEEMRE